MGAQPAVRAVRLHNPLLQCLVGVAPPVLHFPRQRARQVLHRGTQPLRPRARALRALQVVLGEVGPRLRDADIAINFLNSSVQIDRPEMSTWNNN